MLKSKKFKKTLFITVAIICIFLIANTIELFKQKGYKEQENKIREEFAYEHDAKLQEELMKKKVINANMFISEVSNDIELITLKEYGTYTLSHDKTPNNNGFTEWINNSQISIKVDYCAIFKINTKNIYFFVDSTGDITVKFKKSNIILSTIDTSNTISELQSGILGSKYTPIETLALCKIAKENIFKQINTEKNIEAASLNLENHFLKTSKSYNITDIRIVQY